MSKKKAMGRIGDDNSISLKLALNCSIGGGQLEKFNEKGLTGTRSAFLRLNKSLHICIKIPIQRFLISGRGFLLNKPTMGHIETQKRYHLKEVNLFCILVYDFLFFH